MQADPGGRLRTQKKPKGMPLRLLCIIRVLAGGGHPPHVGSGGAAAGPNLRMIPGARARHVTPLAWPCRYSELERGS